MKKIEENAFEYKTFIPDKLLPKNNLYYKRTNKELNTFLLNYFTNDYSHDYKFPVYTPLNRQKTIKRKSIQIRERPSTTKKSNIRSLIDSLRSDIYTGYNYYNKTKGRLQSAKIRSNKLIKHKSYNNIYNTNSLNDSKSSTNTNITNMLSFDSKSKSSKSNFFKSGFSFYSLNKNKSKNKNKKFIFDKNENSNLNSVSFSNNILSPRRIKSNNNISTPQTPSSTRYRSKSKKNTLKLDIDSLFASNKNKRNSRNSSSFSNDPPYKRKTVIIDNKNYFRIRKISSADIKLAREQREFHQKVYLENLNSQVKAFEDSKAFYVDDLKVKSNLISPTKFQRNMFLKKIRKAAKYNNYFFKRFPNQSSKSMRKIIKNHSQPPHENFCSERSKKILKNIQKLQKRINLSKKFIKNLDFRLRTKDIKKVISIVVPVQHKVRDIDEQFKDETINYQKNIGKFFIFKGNGLFSSHLSTILRGDKIVREAIKLENI